MARRWIVAAVIVAVFVAVGAGVAWVTHDDDTSSSDASRSTTTTSAAVSTTAPASTSSTTNVPGSTTTTEAPKSPLADPCGAETAAIRAAIENGVTGARDQATLSTCRQAPTDASWAVVTLVAKPGANFSPTIVVLHGGGGSWAIVDSGTANVACGKVPQQVAVDLGTVCTGGGGGGGL